MLSRRGFCLGVGGMFAMAPTFALAQGKGHGNGHGKDRDDERDDGGEYYRDRDREETRHWYADHRDGLPPGLAKRDQLPPGLEKQLVRRGTLSLLVYRNASNPARRTSNGGCLLLRPTAPTS
jgi:hypothetical protein